MTTRPRRRPALALDAVPTQPRDRWLTHYVRRLAVTDVVVVAAAVAVAHLVRFGVQDSATVTEVNRLLTSAVLTALWVGWLALERTRDPRVVGNGADEYRRVAAATLRMFGTVAILSLVLQLELARGYLAIALPLGLAGLVLGRRQWRRWLCARRASGTHAATVLVVGSARSAADMTRCFERDPAAGYRVVGVCVPRGAGEVGSVLTVDDHAVPVLGDLGALREALRVSGADTVAVTAADHVGHAGMRALAWELQELDVDLVVTPGVVDVAGPRLKVRQVEGLPLVHVEEPQFEGASRITKSAFDLTATVAGLLVLAPLLAVVALLVRLTSPGPVLYRSERMGLDGRPFSMLKFRTMVDGADRQVSDLQAANESDGLLFKIKADPRVTPVGRVLRKLSLDELPQLWNVVRGEMSLVGPRPPLRREVDRYTDDVRRRLLVKPGITGLWQVSGRSDLSWEESVRLDLSYVENWSMVGDLLIIWRTVRAVAAGHGAY